MAPELTLLELLINGPRTRKEIPLQKRTFYRRAAVLRAQGYLTREGHRYKLTHEGIVYAMKQGFSPSSAIYELASVELPPEDMELIEKLDRAAKNLHRGEDPLEPFPQKGLVPTALEWLIVSGICAFTEVIIMKHFGLWHP